jgi:hypothetical protein
MKEIYTKPVVAVDEFNSVDVVTTSTGVDQIEGNDD